jgi:hypothetical protein
MRISLKKLCLAPTTVSDSLESAIALPTLKQEGRSSWPSNSPTVYLERLVERVIVALRRALLPVYAPVACESWALSPPKNSLWDAIPVVRELWRVGFLLVSNRFTATVALRYLASTTTP